MMNKNQAKTKTKKGPKGQRKRIGRGSAAPQMGMGSMRGSMGGPTRMSPGEVITREIPGFRGTSYRTILTYADDFILTTGAGTAGTYVFSANGCYDPNITGTGHQPMAFDQLMLSYEHFCVLRSKLTLTARNSDVDDSPWIGVSLNAGTTPLTDYTVLRENGMIVRQKAGFQTGGESSLVTLVMKYDARRFHSVPSVLTDPDMQGTIAANPVEQGYFHVSNWNTESASTVAMYCTVFIEYDVVFTEPRKNSASLEKRISVLIREELLAKEKEKEVEAKLPVGWALVKKK